MTQIPWVAMQRAFVLLTPEGDQAWGWEGIPQLTCTCKEAASALNSARKELAPAHIKALEREWRAIDSHNLTDTDEEDADSV